MRYQERFLVLVCRRNLPVQNDISGPIKVRHVGEGSKGLMGAADLLRSADLGLTCADSLSVFCLSQSLHPTSCFMEVGKAGC